MKAVRRFSGMNCKKKIDLLFLVWRCVDGGREEGSGCVEYQHIFRPLAGCILKHFSLSGRYLAMAFFFEN